MKKVVALAASFIFFASLKVHAQGCVAVRSTGGVCMLSASHDTVTTNCELYANNRYFRSYRHFVGTKEQKQRVEAVTNLPAGRNTKKIKPEDQDFVSLPAGRQACVLVAYLLYRLF